MQSTGQLINDLVILGIFIFMSLVVSGIIKLKPEKQEKLDSLMERKGTLVKIVAYGGTIIFTLLTLIHSFYKP
jgi:hypothetical protein